MENYRILLAFGILVFWAFRIGFYIGEPEDKEENPNMDRNNKEDNDK